MYKQLLDRLRSDSKSNPCELTFFDRSEWDQLTKEEQTLLSYSGYTFATIEN